MSINTLAAALELKPKSEHLQAQQKIKKLVRRNASDKLKLIQMVHDNPILWDSRLPNFKGAEGEKNRAWEQIGKEFNAPGRRVARAFKSLRESYRRELAHVKLMGSNFKPKWSLYEAMDFLRDVIRERKGGSQSAENAVSVATIGINLSSAFGLHSNDFHQHHHNHHVNHKNNNKNNNNINISNNNNNEKTSNLQSDVFLQQQQDQNKLLSPKFSDNASALNLQQHQQQQQHSPTFNNVTALNLSKCSSTSLSLSNEDFYKFVKPEMDFGNHHHNNGAIGVVAAQQMALHVAHARQHLLNNQQDQNENSVTASTRPSTPISGNTGLSVSHDSRVTSTHNDNQNAITSCNSTQNTLFDETGDGVDGADGSSIQSGAGDGDVGGAGTGDDEHNTHAGNLSRVGSAGEEIEELEAIDADFPYPFILDSNSTTNGCIISKRRRKDILSDNDDDDDDYEMQMMKQHRRLRRHQQQQQQQQQHHAQAHMNGNVGVGSHHMLDIPQSQTVREVLNSKFCGFISAKLNSMEDSEADNLMNKILMLLVQTQANELK